MAEAPELAGIVLDEEVRDDAAEVGEDAIRLGGRRYHAPGEDREPGDDVVAAPFPEDALEAVCPVLASDLEAVHENVVDSALGRNWAQAGENLVNITGEKAGERRLGELVNLQPFAGGRRRTRADAVRGVAEAYHDPVCTGRGGPVDEVAREIRIPRDVHDARGIDCLAGGRRIWIAVYLRAHDERLHAELGDARARFRADGYDTLVLGGESLGFWRTDRDHAANDWIGKCDLRREVAGDADGQDFRDVRDRDEDGIVLVAVAGRIDGMVGDGRAERGAVPGDLYGDERVEVAGGDVHVKRDAAERKGPIECDGGLAFVLRVLDLHAVVRRVDRFGGGAREGENGEVAVKAVRVGWRGKRSRALSAAHDALSEYDVLHRVLGLDPRSAGRAPAAAVGEGQLYAEALGLVVGVAQHVEPGVAAERDVAGGDAVGDVEYLRAAYAGARHGL